ncbi:DNA-binding protein [Salinadaptatus halalkaliphilus]|uniref:DNA-binding protein n=1 Tax=Salinadaptatus halalkaliphilus TaxID=2419781 RepID=A0A4S3TGZ1_9EURY|nr:DNA-binding protein [Salinadaptatus halalkaliphilus]THE63254.1 DNA-binding protein [Salinadaptatus halalkaliphilus]
MPSDPSSIVAALRDAEEAFGGYRSGATYEADLEPDDPEITQLRKACRLLEASRTLRANDGYHTSVIEMSFAAIERTLEWYVLVQSTDTVGDFQSHRYAYDRAAALGLFSQSLCDELYQMHSDNRSAAYYRDTVATAEQADALFHLAVEIHEYTVQHLQYSHECRCSQTH